MEGQLDSFYGNDGDRPLNKPVRRQPLGAGRAETLQDWGPSIRGG
jgi:hypothetical protein